MQFGIYDIDARQHALGNALLAAGHTVTDLAQTATEAMPQAVILPMPAAENGNVYGTDIPLRQILPQLRNSIVFGGRVDGVTAAAAGECGIVIRDYFVREDMTVRNVIPTVEGALQIAMEQTPFTLHGSHTLIVGFGRIGRLLAHHLRALGAEVNVVARRSEHLAWCEALGYNGISYLTLNAALEQSDIVFNTVPAPVLKAEQLAHVRSSCPLIELASKPGGIDTKAAEALGALLIVARALPTRVAPQTAGEIICKTILNMLKEEDTLV